MADTTRVLLDLLGPSAQCGLSQPPNPTCDLSDDHTPAEFSIRFSTGRPVLRAAVEPWAGYPDVLDGLRVVTEVVSRYHGSAPTLAAVEDLFTAQRPQGQFGVWCAFVLHPASPPDFKVYLNPAIHGVDQAPCIAYQALDRLGFATAGRAALAAVDASEGRDHVRVFALDLGAWAIPRVKLYVAHHHADLLRVRAAALTAGIDPTAVEAFCRQAAGPGPYTGRPLWSCYSFTAQHRSQPAGYTLYVPIRSYVPHDGIAQDRCARLLAPYPGAGAVLDRALAALTPRPLDAGVGLIAYVSLTMGVAGRAVTCYLSSEAYGVTPPCTT